MQTQRRFKGQESASARSPKVKIKFHWADSSKFIIWSMLIFRGHNDIACTVLCKTDKFFFYLLLSLVNCLFNTAFTVVTYDRSAWFSISIQVQCKWRLSKIHDPQTKLLKMIIKSKPTAKYMQVTLAQYSSWWFWLACGELCHQL